MMMKDPSSARSVFFSGFDRNNMLKEQHQQHKKEAKQSRQTNKKISSKLEGLSFISKKHQQSEEVEVEEKEENIFLRRKEELRTNLLSESKNTTVNQNMITLSLAKQSSQNMLFSYCKEDINNINRSRNSNRYANRNSNSNRNRITNSNRILSQTNNSNNSDQNDEITLKTLVKKRFGQNKPKQYWFAVATILLFALICFHQLTATTTFLVEAKIHHSKRQAPDQSSSPSSSSSSSFPSSSQSSTGRENNNWWNLWWQQYISDAIQPTVRPIVSVSFNGKTISLSDHQQTDSSNSDDSNSVAQFQPESRDVDTNFVLNNLNSPELNPIDLERNEKLRLISSNLPDNTHPFAAKQMMLAQRKSFQQQANWQSVKPTMIQMSQQQQQQQRETRPNRQANLNQVDDYSSQLSAASGSTSSADLGIQMRTSMSQRRSNNDQQQQVQQEQLILKQPSTGQVIKQTNSLQNLNNQQQQKEDDASRFEQQQQNQMVDYSEESEPELENNISSNATSGIEVGDYQGRVGQQQTSGGQSMSGSEMPAVNIVDSSSSSMMLEQQPQKQFEQQQQQQQKPALNNEGKLDDRIKQQGNVTQVDLMRSKTQSDERPANGLIESSQKKGGELSQSTVVSSTMSPSTIRTSTQLPGKQFGPTNDTTRRQPQVTTQFRQQPQSSKQPVSQSETMTTTSTATQRPFSTSPTTTTTRFSNTRGEGASSSSSSSSTSTTTMAVTEPSSTAAPSSSARPRLVMSTAGDNVDLNETPISIIDNEQPRGQTRGQQQPVKSTTPTGRVELENGRPATGGSRQQMATTTSARLPTRPTTAGASSTTQSRKSSSTTISTTPSPLSETTQTMRFNDSINVAQPGMRIIGTSSTTSKPQRGVAESARTTLTPTSNISTLSPNQQQTETTTMSAGSTTSSETTDSSSGSENVGEDGDDDDDDDETSTSGNDSKQSGGMMSNATSFSDSDDSNDDSSTSSDGESEQDQTTTVSAITTTAKTTIVATQPSIQTTMATAGLSRAQTLTESKIATTTQQPALTTIDIERLPVKDQSGPKSTTIPGMSMVMMRTSTPSTSSSSSSSSTLADISRITRPSSTTTSSTGPQSSSTTLSSSLPSTSSTSTSLSMNQQLRQQQQQQQSIQMPNTNLIMMNLDQTKPSTIGGETAITMPIETLMKMMMMNQIMRENNELRGSTMPIATLEQTTTQTPSTTSSGIVSPSTTEASQGTSTSQATQQTSVSSERSEFSSTVATGKEGDESEKNVSQNADTETSGMFKKKLQPPPTTRQPISSKTQTAGSGQSGVETSQTGSMQTTTTSPLTTTTPTSTSTTVATTTTSSPSSLEADGPTQRTMFVNIEPSSNSMMDVTSGGREEPKIDLINLDLLPIQRIMNSQSSMLNDKLKSNASTQPSVEQQQQIANEIMRGNSQTPTKQLDQLMLEVEPGMRLRPPVGMAGVVMRGTNMVGSIQTNNGQVMGSIKTGVSNPSNTMYTIMTSSSASPAQQQQQQQQKQQGKAHSKKPASSAPSEQRIAAVIPQAPVKSAPNMRQSQQQMMMNSRTMPNTATQQQLASSTIPSNPSSMSSSFQQQITRTTQPVVPFQTTFQTTTTPAPNSSNKNPIRSMSSTSTSASTSTSTTAISNQQTSARPRFMDMNMIELEMEREGSRSTSKTKTEITDMMKMMMMMRKAEQNEKQQQTQMRSNEFNSDFGAVTTVTTTTTKSPTGLETEQQTVFNTTATSAQSASTPAESSTTPRPSLINNTTPSTSSSTSQKQQANLSTVSNLMAQTTTSAATTTTVSTPTTTSTQPTPTSGETESDSQTSTKETTNALSPIQMSANNQQADNSRNNNNNRLDRIQLQQTERRPQQVGTKTGKVSQQAQNKASNSNLTSSFISPKLRTDFNKFSSRVQQQPVRMNDKLVAQQPQKDPAESRQSSVVDSNARVVPTTTQSPIANGMIQNMAIRQFGGANRMSALANQPVPFGRPSAMTIQQQQQQQQQQNKQQQQRFELPSFEYGPSIAVRRPDEPLANGQIPNCTLTGKNFCVLTKDYPMNEVRQAVERSFRSVRIMYEELQTVSDQELHKDDFNSTNNKAASGKFACQTQVEMMRPGWAKDEITKEWMLVVNTDVFPQRVRTESCSQPNTPCEFISPFYDSTCQQRYSLHRMIAIDPHDSSRSPQVAVFKFPAGCVCRVNPIRRTTT